MNDVELAIVKRSIYELFGGDGAANVVQTRPPPESESYGTLVLDFEMDQVHICK